MTDQPLNVCSVGGRTPLGLSIAASAAAVRGAISAVASRKAFLDGAGEPIALAMDAALAADLDVTNRIQRLLIAAIKDALSALPSSGPERPMDCFVGLPEPRAGLPTDVSDSVRGAVAAELRWPLAQIHVVPRGHASGLMAAQWAAQLISNGQISACVIAGADSYITDETLAWLDQTGALMTARNRNGFPPGEAAGAFVLATRDFAERHQWPLLARLRGVATEFEHNTPGSGRVCIGEGLTAAFRDVLAALSMPQELITATYCDLNGQRYRNEEFVYALLRTQQAFVDAHDYLCPADCWGDVGAASGPLYIGLAICSAIRGYARGALPLAWAASERGHRSAAMLQLFQG